MGVVMARIERIKQRLDNWALWKARLNSSGLGYHTRNVLAVDVFSRGSYNGVAIPHFEEDASEINEAIESMKPCKQHLHDTLHHIYIMDLGIKQTARRVGKAESTIKAQLEAADHYIDQWLQAKATERDRVRAQAIAKRARGEL